MLYCSYITYRFRGGVTGEGPPERRPLSEVLAGAGGIFTHCRWIVIVIIINIVIIVIVIIMITVIIIIIISVMSLIITMMKFVAGAGWTPAPRRAGARRRPGPSWRATCCCSSAAPGASCRRRTLPKPWFDCVLLSVLYVFKP